LFYYYYYYYYYFNFCIKLYILETKLFKMGVEALLFLLAAIISAVLLFIMVYFVSFFNKYNHFTSIINSCSNVKNKIDKG